MFDLIVREVSHDGARCQRGDSFVLRVMHLRVKHFAREEKFILSNSTVKKIFILKIYTVLMILCSHGVSFYFSTTYLAVKKYILYIYCILDGYFTSTS
jgi:hypothetical protein